MYSFPSRSHRRHPFAFFIAIGYGSKYFTFAVTPPGIHVRARSEYAFDAFVRVRRSRGFAGVFAMESAHAQRSVRVVNRTRSPRFAEAALLRLRDRQGFDHPTILAARHAPSARSLPQWTSRPASLSCPRRLPRRRRGVARRPPGYVPRKSSIVRRRPSPSG